MLNINPHSAKQDAVRILNSVQDSDNFEDILYQMYVRKKVEQGLADSKEGNFVPDDEMELFWQRWSGK
jgi:hypothetical protein